MMKILRLPLIAGAMLLLTSPPGAAAQWSNLQLQVVISQRTLYVWQGGKMVKSYDVAVGSGEHPTPTGQFAIRHLVWNPRWVPPDAEWARKKSPTEPGDPDNPMKVVKMFFQEPDYYIHGTDADDSLGRAESHGCIRMGENDIEELARTVMAQGGKPKPASWFRRVFRRGTSQGVYLSYPVRLWIQKR